MFSMIHGKFSQSLREMTELCLESIADCLTQISSRCLDHTWDLVHAAFEDDLAETITTTVRKLTVEVEFHLIADETTCHGLDIYLLHLGLNFRGIAHPVRLERHHHLASVRQLHPKCLELLAIAVTGWTKLNLGYGITAKAKAGKWVIRLWGSHRSATTKHWI